MLHEYLFVGSKWGSPGSYLQRACTRSPVKCQRGYLLYIYVDIYIYICICICIYIYIYTINGFGMGIRVFNCDRQETGCQSCASTLVLYQGRCLSGCSSEKWLFQEQP